MKEFIAQVFDAYCEAYKKALGTHGFQPWCEPRHTMHESNQVRSFMEAYKSQVDDVITWMELPLAVQNDSNKKSTAHIDGFIADFENKRLFFIEAKRFSRESQIESLNDDIRRIYDIRENIYVGKGEFKGLNLFEFDAYTLFLADIWEDRGEWAVKLAQEWKKPWTNLTGGPSFVMAKDIKEIITGYHLTFTLEPYFNAEKYREALAITPMTSNKTSPGILVYADEIGFEPLLAKVNQSGKKRKFCVL